MTRSRLLTFMAGLFGIGLFAFPAFCQQSVDIGDASVAGLAEVTIDVTATTTAPTEGFVLAIGYDTDLVSVTGVSVGGTATDDAGAELVVAEIFDDEGGFTLGVVLDFTTPFDGQTIGLLEDEAIANFTVRPDELVGPGTPGFGDCVTTGQDGVPVLFEFMDDTFNSPILNNIIVQDGDSISIVSDISSSSGTVCLLQAPPDSLVIEDVDIPAGGVGCARVLLNNSSGDVQGFVLAIGHEDNLDLEAITLTGTETESVGAEFVVPNIDNVAGGGTVGVVLDFESPFDGQTIEVGENNHIANFCYSCDTAPSEPSPPSEHPLTFENGVFGDPELDNVIVVGGLSLFPELVNGTAFCLPQPLEDTEYFCGGINADGTFNGEEVGDDLEVGDVIATPGSTAEVCVFYVDPTDNLQGFQIAMCLPEESVGILEFKEGSFSIEGTILDEVGTEFLNQSQDNDPDDGEPGAPDGVEMTVGILLDALPPFDDQSVPQTDFPLAIGCFEVTVSDSAECNTCYGIDFCDGVDASEALPVKNVVVADFRSVQNFVTNSCSVCIEAAPEFQRGDCNLDEKIDIADAAAMLGAQFQGLDVACLDACDANDDGKVNLADTVFNLNYLFKSGDAPSDPGPIDPGPDPTADDLDCEEGVVPCL